MRKTFLNSILCCLLLAGFARAEVSADESNQIYDSALYQALKYRLIGPFRGGRVTAVTGIADEPHTFFMGSTGGGLWKSDDAGQSWKNITDGQIGVGSIGAIEVAPSDRNVLYLGTGSSSPRGNISIGDGIYKSVDGGKEWKHAGLPKAGLISRIRVHPKDPDLVYAAVLGNIFGPNPERGVYRSRDGGKSWEKVLFLSDQAGAVDLSMDQSNPRILYAGMWRVERKPWTLIDGSEEGGVYKSTDGGDNWEKLGGGLPESLLGRVGVAVSPADPNRVWVIQEAEGGGVFLSDDAGEVFRRVNKDRKLRQRHWYYTRIYADPVDENTVYVTNTGFYRSVDAGKTFERIGTPHGDNHDLWVNPRNNRILINSNDGGANVSLNGGRSWSSQYNQPTSELYRLTVDNQYPYRVYGAQQDNSTISVPSRPVGNLDPIQDWMAVGGGESGHIAVDPRDPDVIYAGNYIGQITRLDRKRAHVRDVVAYPQMHDGLAGHEIRYRFQWNAPIRISPHDPDVLYHCSQYVHRSRDGGQSWQVISPDLTTNRREYQEIPGGPVQHDHTGVELYTTIFAFEESPHQAGLLWVGSDDGRVHLSPDNGQSWKEITPEAMPEEGTVNMIDLSAHDAQRAFMAVYRYRRNDFRPYIFRTNDSGASWELLTDGSNGIPDNHFVRVVREDPDRRGLLYAGTEFGMYVSFDDGVHWQEFQLNLPRTPITDLAVHRGDLVVATQGRSFWILDDLTSLHQLDAQVASSDWHLFAPRQAYRTNMPRRRGADGPQSPTAGALIRYYLKEKPGKEAALKLEVLDSEGAVIRTFVPKPEKKDPGAKEEEPDEKEEKLLEAKPGMNAFEWDLRYPQPKLVKGSVMSLSRTAGPLAPPGQFGIRMTLDGQSRTHALQVVKDPRWESGDSDLRDQFELAMAVRDQLQASHDAIRKIRSIRSQSSEIARRAIKAGHDKSIRKMADELGKKLTALEEELIQTKNESGQDPINFPPRLDNQIAYLFSVVNSQNARPTEGAYQRHEDLSAELKQHLDRLQGLIEKDLQEFNQLLRREGAGGVIAALGGGN